MAYVVIAFGPRHHCDAITIYSYGHIAVAYVAVAYVAVAYVAMAYVATADIVMGDIVMPLGPRHRVEADVEIALVVGVSAVRAAMGAVEVGGHVVCLDA